MVSNRLRPSSVPPSSLVENHKHEATSPYFFSEKERISGSSGRVSVDYVCFLGVLEARKDISIINLR